MPHVIKGVLSESNKFNDLVLRNRAALRSGAIATRLPDWG